MSNQVRERIRESVMQLIYQMDAVQDFDFEHQTPVDELAKSLHKDQAVRTLTAFREHQQAIDAVIDAHLEQWSIERLPRVELAILRLAVCELYYIDEVPASVAINEAVNLAKRYGDERSYAFVNSVLGRINRERDHA